MIEELIEACVNSNEEYLIVSPDVYYEMCKKDCIDVIPNLRAVPNIICFGKVVKVDKTEILFRFEGE